MKKIFILLTLFTGLIACKNWENEFQDFDYTSGYFPYQYPVRTLVLGDYIYPNENDNNHKFLISAAMGGVYENKKDRVFNIELAPSLCDNVKFNATGEPIHLMPQSYYTLSSSSQIIIPAGKVNGNIEVQLSNAFFDDPLAIKLGYVIPVRLLGSADVDTVLQGKSSKSNPDPRVAGQWDIVPKDFTIFAVKYINQYHGNYLHRGRSIVTNATGNIIENNIYHKQYVVEDEIWKLITTGKTQVSITQQLNSLLVPGTVKMDLLFDNDENCTITKTAGSDVLVTGTGKFVKDGDEWGGKKRNTIILSYNCLVPFTNVPITPDILDDTDASITYTGAWTKYTDAPAYNGGTHYAGTPSDFFTFKFTGVAVALYFKTGGYGTFDVYLDDMSTPIATDISAAAPSIIYQVKLFEKTGLTNSEHTIKCAVKQNKNVPFDYYTVTKASSPLPSGIYKYSVNDTLVIRDRAVTMEVYDPVVFK